MDSGSWVGVLPCGRVKWIAVHLSEAKRQEWIAEGLAVRRMPAAEVDRRLRLSLAQLRAEETGQQELLT